MDHKLIVHTLLRERGRITSLIWSILRDGHESDDLFQEVCLRALDRENSFSDEAHLLRWALKISRHKAIDLLRASNRKVLLMDDATMSLLEDRWCDRDLPAWELGEALEHCIGLLPAPSRHLLDLRYREAMNGKTIAKARGQKRDAVYKALQRIHSILHDCIRNRIGSAAAEAGDV